MKRYAIILLILITAAACHKGGDDVLTERKDSKKVEFHVHASPQYSTQQLNQIQAEVRLSIYKENLATHANQLVWDTVISKRALAQYPHLPQKIVIEKDFSTIAGKEILKAKYDTYFHTPDGMMQQSNSESGDNGNHFLFLDVGI